MDAKKLKCKIVEKGLTISKTAELIGVHKSTLYKKINGFEKMTVSDAVRLKEVLGLTDLEALAIFLPRNDTNEAV